MRDYHIGFWKYTKEDLSVLTDKEYLERSLKELETTRFAVSMLPKRLIRILMESALQK